MKLEELLSTAAERRASDILLTPGAPPAVRVHGQLHPLQTPPLDRALTEEIVRRMVPEAQRERLGEDRVNSSMSDAEIAASAELDREARSALIAGHGEHALSGRGWNRVIKVARTCADLDGARNVGAEHIAEALSLRRREAP